MTKPTTLLPERTKTNSVPVDHPEKVAVITVALQYCELHTGLVVQMTRAMAVDPYLSAQFDTIIQLLNDIEFNSQWALNENADLAASIKQFKMLLTLAIAKFQQDQSKRQLHSYMIRALEQSSKLLEAARDCTGKTSIEAVAMDLRSACEMFRGTISLTHPTADNNVLPDVSDILNGVVTAIRADMDNDADLLSASSVLERCIEFAEPCSGDVLRRLQAIQHCLTLVTTIDLGDKTKEDLTAMLEPAILSSRRIEHDARLIINRLQGGGS